MTGWLLDTTDATGAILNRKIADAQYDRSIGFVNLICEDYMSWRASDELYPSKPPNIRCGLR